MTTISFSQNSRLSCYGKLFFQTLLFKEAGVVTVAGEELVVSAEFSDAAAHKHGDLVSVAGRGDSVGDEDGGAAFHDAVEAAEDPLFGVGVDAGQGVVEDENFGVADDGAGDSCALFLTAGEGESTLADLGVEA